MAKTSGGQFFALQPGSPAAHQLEQAILALDREASRPTRQEQRPRWYLGLLAGAWLMGALARRLPAQLALILMLPLLTGMGGMRHEDPDARAGLSALEDGDFDKALKAFDLAAKRGAHPALDYNRGVALLRRGDAEKAAASFARAAARLEGDGRADAEAARGMALARSGNKKEALKALAQALRLKPNHAVATPWLRHLLAPKQQPPKKDDEEKKPNDDNSSKDGEQGDAGPRQDAAPRGDGGGEQPQDQKRSSGDEEEQRPEAGPQSQPQPQPMNDGGPAPQSQDGGPPPPQPQEGKKGDAGPPQDQENLLRNYRARERLLPMDLWKGAQPRRPVEKDW